MQFHMEIQNDTSKLVTFDSTVAVPVPNPTKLAYIIMQGNITYKQRMQTDGKHDCS